MYRMRVGFLTGGIDSALQGCPERHLHAQHRQHSGHLEGNVLQDPIPGIASVCSLPATGRKERLILEAQFIRD